MNGAPIGGNGALGGMVAAPFVAAARPSLDDLQAQIDALGEREVVIAVSATDTAIGKVVTAQCPPGKVSLSGGWRITFAPGGGSVGQRVPKSYPDTDSSWTVNALAPTTPTAWTLTVYVVCAAL